MNSVIFRYCTRTILPIIIVFSIFLLLRGHNNPGGGFIGGLVAAAAVTLYYIAHHKMPEFILMQHWQAILVIGSICLLASLLLPTLAGKTVLTGLWLKLSLLGETLYLGTPLLFDIGVYLLVLGSVIIMVQTLEN